MRIEKVSLTDFLSYASVEFSPQSGLTLIDGKNGSGKTALVTAIEWALFGKCSRENQRSSDLIRFGKDAARVQLELSVGTFDISVDRQVTLSKGGTFHVTVNGTNITCSSMKETQRKLEEIIGCDHKSFCSVAFYAQGSSSMAALTDTEQKKILEQLLGFEHYRKGRQAAVEALGQLRIDLSRSRSKLELALRMEAEKQSSKEALLKQKEEINKKKATGIQDLKDKIKNLSYPTAPDPEVLSHLEDEMKVYEEYILSRQLLTEEMTAVYAELVAAKSSYNYAVQRYQDLKALHQNNQVVDETCPTCNQKLPENTRVELSKREAVTQSTIDEVHDNINKLDDEISRLRSNHEHLEYRLKKEGPQKPRLEEEKKKHKDYEYQKKLVDAQKKMLEEQISGIEELDTDSIDKALLVLEEEIVDILYEQAQHDAESKSIQDQIPYYEFWIKGYGRGIQTLLIDTYLPYLNNRASLYLRELTNGAGSIEIVAQSETKSGELRDKISIRAKFAKGPNAYYGKSGGERRRVDLAIQFALGDLARARQLAPIELCVLDEVFSYLDPGGREAVVRLLKKHICPQVGTVLVISHEDDIKDKFENVVSVTMVNEVSHVA